jgi:hypothetical protein
MVHTLYAVIFALWALVAARTSASAAPPYYFGCNEILRQHSPAGSTHTPRTGVPWRARHAFWYLSPKKGGGGRMFCLLRICADILHLRFASFAFGREARARRRRGRDGEM